MLRVSCLRPIALCALVVLVCAFPLPLAAADDGPVGLTTDGRPIPVAPEVIARNQAGVAVRATRITTPIVLDGQLDESVYSQVKPMTEFVQQDPKEGAPVSEHTEAWVLYDDRNIYIACRCLGYSGSDNHSAYVIRPIDAPATRSYHPPRPENV